MIDILPPHTAAEEHALRTDLTETRRLLVPVVVDEGGKIIDGILRSKICTELGIDWMNGAELVHGLSAAEKQALRIRLNILRRTTPPNRKQRQEYIAILLKADPSLSTAAVAQLVGVDPTTVGRHRSLLHLPELVIKGLDGKTRKITRTYLRGQKDLQPVSTALTVLGNQKPDGRIAPLKARFLAQEKERVERSLALEHVEVEGIHHCDFRTLEIESGTVDLIWTDVPWGNEYTEVWDDIGRLALNWLAPGGVCAVKIGNKHLANLLMVMGKHLEYQWCLANVFENVHGVLERCGIQSFWRPIVIFSRRGDTIELHGVEDILYTDKEKDRIDWQQPVDESVEIVKRFSPPNALVLDPCMGSGTAGIACVRTGRRFVGCEILEERWKIASNAIAAEREKRRIA